MIERFVLFDLNSGISFVRPGILVILAIMRDVTDWLVCEYERYYLLMPLSRRQGPACHVRSMRDRRERERA